MTVKQAVRYVLVGHPHEEGNYADMSRRAFVVGVYDCWREAAEMARHKQKERWTPDAEDTDRTTYPVMYVTHWVRQEVVV